MLTRPLVARKRETIPNINATDFDPPEIAYMRIARRADESHVRALVALIPGKFDPCLLGSLLPPLE